MPKRSSAFKSVVFEGSIAGLGPVPIFAASIVLSTKSLAADPKRLAGAPK